jgi:hypothetical protein
LKKKSVFGKLGILALVVLLLALGTGVVYGMWTQTINVDVSSNTGTLTWTVTGGVPYSSPSGGSVSDSITSTSVSNTVNVTITNPNSNDTYYVPITISNTGTVPLIIQSVTFAGAPNGVLPFELQLPKGYQLDPGAVQSVTITIGGIPSTVTKTFTFTMTVVPVQWNLYVP